MFAQVQKVAACLVCLQVGKKDKFNFLISSHAMIIKGIHHLGVSGKLPLSAGYPLTQRAYKSALMDDVPEFTMVHTVNTLSIGCIRTLICLDWPRLAVLRIPSVRTLDTQSYPVGSR